ncbi:MAG: DegT/DnrJ/EryC1/StrS family aminotransferase [Magnetococcales bacterium]|nr:DegT/DnrJ/EryC1/StrS family aminotransferase [Magnetococcales bacterium]
MTSPFVDAPRLRRWEATWEGLWQRRAVVFATPGEGLAALRQVMGWPPGEDWWLSPLLAPGWREGGAAAALAGRWLDVASESGLARLDESHPPARGWILPHPFGLPQPAPAPGAFRLEEISGVLRPFAGCGWGEVQAAWLDGNGLLAGGGCPWLCGDDALAEALRGRRRRLPSALSCELGLAQMERLETLLAMRRERAEGYLALRDRGLYGKPPGGERAWEGFHLQLPLGAWRDDLAAFLRKGGIGAGPPIGWAAADLPQEAHPAGEGPGMTRLRQCGLRLPLYAALSRSDHKKIINRLHRWTERRARREGDPPEEETHFLGEDAPHGTA